MAHTDPHRARRARRDPRVGVVLLAILVLWAAPPVVAPAWAQSTRTTSDPGLRRIEAEIGRLAELAGGVVGVGAIHLETGRSVYLNPDERFHTASTRKFPSAVELMSQVDQGMLRQPYMTSSRTRVLPGLNVGIIDLPDGRQFGGSPRKEGLLGGIKLVASKPFL